MDLEEKLRTTALDRTKRRHKFELPILKSQLTFLFLGSRSYTKLCRSFRAILESNAYVVCVFQTFPIALFLTAGLSEPSRNSKGNRPPMFLLPVTSHHLLRIHREKGSALSAVRLSLSKSRRVDRRKLKPVDCLLGTEIESVL